MVATITTFQWVPPFARGLVRDLRARWAFEEEGIAYEVRTIEGPYSKTAEHRRFQPFGQVPTYADDEVTIFESGAIALRIAEMGTKLLPSDPPARFRAIQWLISALNSVEPWIMQQAAVELFEADREWTPLRRAKVMEDLDGRLADLAGALGEKTWLDGDHFTIGDLMMVSVLGGLRNSAVLDRFPNLAAYVARGEARPAHQRAMADQLALYGRADAA